MRPERLLPPLLERGDCGFESLRLLLVRSLVERLTLESSLSLRFRKENDFPVVCGLRFGPFLGLFLGLFRGLVLGVVGSMTPFLSCWLLRLSLAMASLCILEVDDIGIDNQ